MTELETIRFRTEIILQSTYAAYMSSGRKALRDHCRELTFILSGSFGRVGKQ
jgi:hypothetical protein